MDELHLIQLPPDHPHRRLAELCRAIDLPRALCRHLAGEDHSLAHRLAVGGIVMVVGAGMAHYGPILVSGVPVLHSIGPFAFDVVGYLIHGLGSVPYVEAVLAAVAVAE